MILAYKGILPVIAPEVRIMDGAFVIGDVSLGPGSSIWFNSVLRGDDNAIRIGRDTNIQDLCMIHSAERYPCLIGDEVTVGHRAIVHGSKIASRVLIGMGALILDGCEIGEESIIGAGSLLLQNSSFPSGVLIVGSPAKIKRELTQEERADIAKTAGHYRRLAEIYKP